MKLALESGGIMWYNRDVNTYEGYGPFLLPDFLTTNIIGNRAVVLNGPASYVLTAANEGLRDCGFSFSGQKNKAGVCTTGFGSQSKFDLKLIGVSLMMSLPQPQPFYNSSGGGYEN